MAVVWTVVLADLTAVMVAQVVPVDLTAVMLLVAAACLEVSAVDSAER